MPRYFYQAARCNLKITDFQLMNKLRLRHPVHILSHVFNLVYAARYYRNKLGMKIYVGYFFNHDSPFRTEWHVNQKIIKAVKRINAGSHEKLELGNIEVKKEFNYAGDVVEAVWLLINQNDIFEAVIGSGEAHSIKEWLEYCFMQINKKWQDYVILKNEFVPEYETLVSNPQLICSLGWGKKVGFRQLADLMMGDMKSAT